MKKAIDYGQLLGEWEQRGRMALLFQNFSLSKGPINISYNRKLSAPSLSTISSGVTPLSFDLDIFSLT